VPVSRDERVGHFVGAILITEGVLVAILRFLALVYTVSSEAFNADRFRTPLPHFLPWVLVTVAVSFVLVWAGSFLRRAPTGAWRDVGVDARIDLVAACLLNVGALLWAASGLARSPSTGEGWIIWIVLAVASLVTIAGILRDATTRHPD
jgi:predicted transporter